MPTAAQALTVPLTFEFDDGVEGDYGSIIITQTLSDSGTQALFFQIQAGPDLGPEPDLHYFYFNLLGSFADLTISSDDNVFTDYTLDDGFPVNGGAGSSFDHSVFFGHGGGPKGNGTLELASFTISSSSDISLLDLAELSQTAGGLDTLFALHWQNTGPFGGGSETVGANVIVPEPASFGLLAAGLIGLAAAGRRRSSPR